MADRLEDTDLKSVQSAYAERFAADLVANRSEQGEITAQIAQLQTRLEQLKKDEGWLAGIQETLPNTAPAARSTPAETSEAAQPAAAEPDTKAVPKPRSAKGTRTKTARPKAAEPKAAAKKPAAVKSTARKPVKKASGGDTVAESVAEAAAPKTAEAPLHQLLREFLPAGEPRLVREVHADLEKVYPERKTSAQVVRNSLETLVKRGVISKEIQKGSAMYTAPKPAEAAAKDVEVAAKA